MELSPTDRALLAALQAGLPLTARPYAALGAPLGLDEGAVLAALDRLCGAEGPVARFGVIVRHRALGYVANAMCVWDVPDALVGTAGRYLAGLPCVSLCYRRPRRPPDWPYNLFCMIHGKDQDSVRAQVADAAQGPLENCRHEILFSTRCFKQTAGRHFAEIG